MSPLIAPEQTVLLLAIVLAIVTVAIALEQRFKWASFFGAFFICMLLGFGLSNLNIIPHSAPAFDSVDSIILLVSMPMFLFKANLRTIFKESGKLFGLFHVAAVGTVVASVVLALVFGKIPLVQNILPVMTAGAVGGTVNCVAVGNIYGIDADFMSSYLVADNFTFILMILIINALHRSNLIKKYLPRPHTEKVEASIDKEALQREGKTLSAGFWGGKEISMKDIAVALATSFSIIGVSQVLATLIKSFDLPAIVITLFGNVYMLMTIITVVLATAFPKFFNNIRGSMELGNIGFLMWFTIVGIAGDLVSIVENGLIVVGFLMIIFLTNMIFSIVGAKVLKCSWEDAVMANMASIGGPPTVAAIAGSFAWVDIIIPAMLVGLWGYVIGNYAGILIATMIL